MKRVCYCQNNFEAEVIKGRLENEGIESCVINENIHNMIPLSSVIESMAVQVVVEDCDIDRAKALLGEHIDTEQQPAIVCPECGSEEIDYGFWGSKKGIKKIIAILLLPFLALSGGMIGNMRNNYYCHKCHHEFRL